MALLLTVLFAVGLVRLIRREREEVTALWEEACRRDKRWCDSLLKGRFEL